MNGERGDALRQRQAATRQVVDAVDRLCRDLGHTPRSIGEGLRQTIPLVCAVPADMQALLAKLGHHDRGKS